MLISFTVAGGQIPETRSHAIDCFVHVLIVLISPREILNVASSLLLTRIQRTRGDAFLAHVTTPQRTATVGGKRKILTASQRSGNGIH